MKKFDIEKIKILMQIARKMASLSIAERAKVGALIVKNRRIISSGYNGLPSGMLGKCEDDKGNTLSEVIHAEENAILWAYKNKIDISGASLIITMLPCLNCSKMIVNANIKEVFYQDVYRSLDGLDFLNQHNVEVHRIGD